MPMNAQTFEQRAAHLQGERWTCYGAFVLILVLTPWIMLKAGYRGWLNAMRLMRDNLKVVKAEEARLRRYAEKQAHG